MCLAVPLQITRILSSNRALVQQGDGTLEIDTSLLEAPQAGDYVLVHAGFAIEKIDQEEAAQTLEILEEIGESSGGPA